MIILEACGKRQRKQILKNGEESDQAFLAETLISLDLQSDQSGVFCSPPVGGRSNTQNRLKFRTCASCIFQKGKMQNLQNLTERANVPPVLHAVTR